MFDAVRLQLIALSLTMLHNCSGNLLIHRTRNVDQKVTCHVSYKRNNFHRLNANHLFIHSILSIVGFVFPLSLGFVFRINSFSGDGLNCPTI